jgi:cyanophycin synthetase
MSVQRDGRGTVEQLVQEAVRLDRRKPGWRSSGIQPIDAAAVAAMSTAGFAPASILAQGRWVPLRRIESTADGGVDEDVSRTVHADNIEIARRAAALFQLEVAGIDIIADDITVPWHASRAIINEVNYSPLLGGGEISRSNIGRFLDELLPGRGQIPIELFVGGPEALERARLHAASLAATHPRCWITSSQSTQDTAGRARPMAAAGARAAVAALLLDAEVDAVVVVMTQKEFEESGPPLPGLLAHE